MNPPPANLPSIKLAVGGEFFSRLEAIRGLAAMMVAVAHSLIVLEDGGWQRQVREGLLVLFNGRAAVTLFFVLSGFVLGMALRRGHGGFLGEYLRFAFRRVFRIYPAFLAVLALVLVYLVLFHEDRHYPGTSAWFQRYYHEPVTATLVVRNFLLLDHSLNDVTWTLQSELLCSLLLPILHFVSIRLRPWARGLLFVSLLVCPLFLPIGSCFYLFMFYLGYLLPEIGPSLMAFLNSIRCGRSLMLLLAGAGYFGARWIKWPVMGSYLLETVSGAFLICCVLYGVELRAYRLLDHPIVKFYGRISYSFYLLHFFCLFLVSLLFLKWVPEELLSGHTLWFGWFLWLASTAVATPLAWLSYVAIEKPAIRFSKAVCATFVSERNDRDSLRG